MYVSYLALFFGNDVQSGLRNVCKWQAKAKYNELQTEWITLATYCRSLHGAF